MARLERYFPRAPAGPVDDRRVFSEIIFVNPVIRLGRRRGFRRGGSLA